MIKRKYVVAVSSLAIILVVVGSLFYYNMVQAQGPREYDPWCDLNDDGKIDIDDVVDVALKFGTYGDPIVKASLTYDTGWVDITDKAGQYFNITHNMNSTDVIVDITGKTTLAGGVHQRHLGGTGYTQGWSQTYGGEGAEIAYSVVQTVDGGYAIAGETNSFGAGDSDFWLVKTDWTGDLQWNKTYGGANDDIAGSVVQTSDGGFAIVGRTASFGAGLEDAWLVKTDSAGNMEWNKTYYGGDQGNSVVETVDGGYAIAGYTWLGAGDSDFWLVKVDDDGNHQWNKTYGGSNEDWTYSVEQTSDAGYAIAGITRSFGAGLEDAWLVKTDSAGNMEWNKTYGGQDNDGAMSLVETSDAGYAIAGYSSWDFWLVKTDSFGNAQWNKTYGGVGADWATTVVQTSNGGYAVTGWTQTPSFGVSVDFWLVKTEVESGLAWTDSTDDTVTLYRAKTDAYWNYVRVRIWKIKETP